MLAALIPSEKVFPCLSSRLNLEGRFALFFLFVFSEGEEASNLKLLFELLFESESSFLRGSAGGLFDSFATLLSPSDHSDAHTSTQTTLGAPELH